MKKIFIAFMLFLLSSLAHAAEITFTEGDTLNFFSDTSLISGSDPYTFTDVDGAVQVESVEGGFAVLFDIGLAPVFIDPPPITTIVGFVTPETEYTNTRQSGSNLPYTIHYVETMSSTELFGVTLIKGFITIRNASDNSLIVKVEQSYQAIDQGSIEYIQNIQWRVVEDSLGETNEAAIPVPIPTIAWLLGSGLLGFLGLAGIARSNKSA